MAVLERRKFGGLLPNMPHQKTWVVVAYEPKKFREPALSSQAEVSISDDDCSEDFSDLPTYMLRHQVYDLDDLLSDSSVVSEVIDWGNPQGQEVW